MLLWTKLLYNMVAPKSVRVLGLVQVRLGMQYTNNLTNWSCEAEALRAFLLNPTADAYLAHVTRAFAWQVPLGVSTMLDSCGVVRKLSTRHGRTLHPNFFDEASMREFMGARGNNVCSLEALCGEWDIDLHNLHRTLGVVLPLPVAECVVRGQWHDIVLQGSWKLPRPLFPAQQHLFTDPPVFEGLDRSPIGHREIAAAIRSLRSWAPIILEAADPLEERLGP